MKSSIVFPGFSVYFNLYLSSLLQKHNISSSSSINSLLLNFMFPDLSSLIASADKPSVNKIAYGTFVTFFELYIISFYLQVCFLFYWFQD